MSNSPVFELVSPNRVTSDVIACSESLDDNEPIDYRQLAPLLLQTWQDNQDRLVGIAGGQGSGKSTLGKLIQAAGDWFGVRVAVLSLDDFYLTLEERRGLANEVHPLLSTRGPPGTHDTQLLYETLTTMVKGESVVVPYFDKSRDDRAGEREIDSGQELVVLEGWCVGSRPQNTSQLQQSINELERRQDPHGVWRNYVHKMLGERYVPIWELLDRLTFLAVQDLNSVRRWRLQQESNIAEELRHSESWVAKFVAYYQRITEDMMREAPKFADPTVQLNADHRVVNIHFR